MSSRRLWAELEKISAQFAKVYAEIAKLRSELNTVRADVMERIDRLQGKVVGIRDDIEVNMGRADHSHRIADSVRGELRALSTVVSGMHRQIATLQAEVRGLRGEA